MTTLAPAPAPTGKRGGYSEYGVVGLLAGLGVLVLIETQSIKESLAGQHTLGPRIAPYFVGGMLLVVAAFLALDIARGGRGEQEAGEDIDLSHGTDWITLSALAALVAGTGQLIPLIGFPLAGMILILGVVRLLGSRRLLVDLLVSAGLSVSAFLLFTEVLGIYLPRFGGE